MLAATISADADNFDVCLILAAVALGVAALASFFKQAAHIVAGFALVGASLAAVAWTFVS